MGSKTSSSAAVSLLAKDDDDAAAADTASSPQLVARGRLFLIDWWRRQCGTISTVCLFCFVSVEIERLMFSVKNQFFFS
jgi:hypothetical protein